MRQSETENRFPSETLHGLHLQACRSEYHSLENQNRGYAAKAMGVAAFSATIFGLSQASITDEKIDIVTLTLTILMALALAGTLVYAFRIIRLKDWKSSFDINEAVRALPNCDTREMEMGLSYACTYAIHVNQAILESKTRLFDHLAGYAGMQFVLNAILLIYTSAAKFVV